eukprot:TRINITY_DN46173_c0_g1_i1.p2 TRINITY_DN46173_c0_g1~~TRINITY_DN46173_c0_g1_i1.p2  ORF type:complete len:134 (-),score=17.86 TRINITY_DN46173_c0_g1_i1:78-479(-)
MWDLSGLSVVVIYWGSVLLGIIHSCREAQHLPVPTLDDGRLPYIYIDKWLDGHSRPRPEGIDLDWRCAICLGSEKQNLVAFCEDEQGRIVHGFHRECIKGWLARSGRCPCCRRCFCCHNVGCRCGQRQYELTA